MELSTIDGKTNISADDLSLIGVPSASMFGIHFEAVKIDGNGVVFQLQFVSMGGMQGMIPRPYFLREELVTGLGVLCQHIFQQQKYTNIDIF